MDNLNKVKIEVAGAGYTIATTEQEGYVRDLAKEMSDDIDSLMVRNPSLSMNDALVLCAIAYLSEYKKAEANCDHIRSQLKEYLGDTARARMKTNNTNHKTNKLTKKIKKLHKHYKI